MGVSCNARFVILEDGLFGAIPYMMREDYCLDYCQRIVLNIRRTAIASTFYQKSNIRSLLLIATRSKGSKFRLSRSLPTRSSISIARPSSLQSLLKAKVYITCHLVVGVNLSTNAIRP